MALISRVRSWKTILFASKLYRSSVLLDVHDMYVVWIRKRVGGLKLDELPGVEALQIPGLILIMWLAGNIFLDATNVPMSTKIMIPFLLLDGYHVWAKDDEFNWVEI